VRSAASNSGEEVGRTCSHHESDSQSERNRMAVFRLREVDVPVGESYENVRSARIAHLLNTWISGHLGPEAEPAFSKR
jgi:hypothetical protein